MNKFKFLIILSSVFIRCLADDDQEAKDLINKICPNFYQVLYAKKDSCEILGKKLQEKQKTLQNSDIVKGILKSQDLKKQYDALQSQALTCRSKANVNCKDIASKVISSLTNLNSAISDVMKILNAKYPTQIPSPQMAQETLIPGYTFTKVANYDQTVLLNVAKQYLNDPNFDPSFMDNFDKITQSSNDYQTNYNSFQKCLSSVSHDCDSLTQKAYDTFSQMNQTLATVMTKLNKLYPKIIDKPKLEQATADTYKFTQISNYDAQQFSKAMIAYSAIPSEILQGLNKCQTLGDNCKISIDEYVAEQKGKIAPQLIANLTLQLGGLWAAEKGIMKGINFFKSLSSTGVVGSGSGAAAIDIGIAGESATVVSAEGASSAAMSDVLEAGVQIIKGAKTAGTAAGSAASLAGEAAAAGTAAVETSVEGAAVAGAAGGAAGSAGSELAASSSGGPIGIAVGLVLVAVTFIPQVNDAITAVADWIADGFYALFGTYTRHYAPAEIIPQELIQAIQIKKEQIAQEQIAQEINRQKMEKIQQEQIAQASLGIGKEQIGQAAAIPSAQIPQTSSTSGSSASTSSKGGSTASKTTTPPPPSGPRPVGVETIHQGL